MSPFGRKRKLVNTVNMHAVPDREGDTENGALFGTRMTKILDVEMARSLISIL
jgi:hypothetical protein